MLNLGPFEFHKLEGCHVDAILENLDDRNVREFEEFYNVDPRDHLPLALDYDLSHAITHNGDIVAICGADGGQFWMVFSTKIKRVWRSAVRRSMPVIEFYHAFYDELYSDVWSENEFTHQWLAFLGFQPEFTGLMENGHTVVRFVRCNHWTDDIVSPPSRPVMH